jgi:hypothetical protein
MRKTHEQRFWSKVARRGPDDCWEWQGNRDWFGHGQMMVDYATRSAHRLSWEFANGKIGAGLCVLHRCDNPPCVNPEHLFLGTQGDNVRDMDAKGRRKNAPHPGTKNGRAKLTENDVRWLRLARVLYGATCRGLADAYGVSPAAVVMACNGTNWRSVT